MLQDAVIRNVEVLGEACHQLLRVLPDAASRFPQIPFRTIYATRNRLIHGYHTVQLEFVWNILENDIPELNMVLADLLASWPEELS